MQSANKRIGKLPKKLKLAANETTLKSINKSTTEPITEPTTMLTTVESINKSTTKPITEPITVESINESTTELIIKLTTLESINEFTTNQPFTKSVTLEFNKSVIVKPNIIKPLKALGEGIY
jgi:hypothetical protein